MSINELNDIELLYDLKNGTSKEIGWKAHRLVTLRLAQAYKRLHSPKYDRMLKCGNYLAFRRYEDNSLRLDSAKFCQIRICPTCMWRRSRKIFVQLSKIVEAIEKDGYRYLFLTLTIKNCMAFELSNQMDKMFNAYKKMCLRREFVEAVKGWFRAFECTINWKTSEFHPHFHVVLAVDSEYFSKQSDLYIPQEDFKRIWQECLAIDYEPIVDIRTLKESEKGKGKELAELCKYPLKPGNLMADLRAVQDFDKAIQEEARRMTDEQTDTIVATLDGALKYRRLIGFGGIFKDKHRELNLDDVEDGDLIIAGYDELDKKGDINYEIERYRWNIGLKNYVKIEGNNTQNGG